MRFKLYNINYIERFKMVYQAHYDQNRTFHINLNKHHANQNNGDITLLSEIIIFQHVDVLIVFDYFTPTELIINNKFTRCYTHKKSYLKI